MAKRRKRKGKMTANQRRFKAAAKTCKGEGPNFQSCMSEELSGTGPGRSRRGRRGRRGRRY